MRKYQSFLMVLFLLFKVFPNHFYVINKSIASISSSSSDEFEGEEEEKKKEKERPDPPFVKLVLNGNKNVYVLGSIHHAYPYDVLEADSAYKFLIEEELLGSDKTAIFIEHELSNTMLSAIINRKRLVNNWKSRFEEWALKQNGVTSVPILSELEDHAVVLNLNMTSFILENAPFGYTIENVFDEDPWIALGVLGSHLGLNMYSRFGGFEYAIVRAFFRNRDFHFLETAEPYYYTLKANKKEKEEDIFKEIDSTFINIFTLPEMKDEKPSLELINSIYSFERMIKNSDLDLDVIARNKLWIKNLIENKKLFSVLSAKENVLIIVGFDHLKGNESFLSLLISKLSTAILLKTKFRYSYIEKDWIIWN